VYVPQLIFGFALDKFSHEYSANNITN